MATVIDLTSDDVDVPSAVIIDLTSAEERRPPGHVSEVKVEDSSPALVGSSTADSGGSSPNTQRTDDTVSTEPDPAGHSKLGFESSQDEGNNSSDNDLGKILANNRKRKSVSGDTPSPGHRVSGIQLDREALAPLAGSQPLKPGFDKFFSIHSFHVDDSSPAIPLQNETSKTQPNKRVMIQQGLTHSTNNANPQILNIDREEVLGSRTREPRKQRSKPDTRPGPAMRKAQADAQPLRRPVPRRAASEAPETARLDEKTRTSGIARTIKPREGAETQRAHKRRRQSGQDDAFSRASTLSATLNSTRSKVPPTDKVQSHGPETTFMERFCGTGRVADTHRGSQIYRPGDSQTHREKRRGQVERSFMPAAHNGRGHWRSGGLQRYGMLPKRPSKGAKGRGAHSSRDWSQREARGQPPDVLPDISRLNSMPESETANIDTVEQVEDIGELQETPGARSQEPQQVHGTFRQQESRKIHPAAVAPQSATRVEQEQMMSSETRKKVIEQARQLFENHPSNIALQRKVEVASILSPAVSKPNFAFRCQMVNASTGKRLGRKSRTATQQAEKRDKDRQRRILARRQKLEREADQLWPNESRENKEKWIEEGLAKLKQTFMKNDQKREAQKSQGLLTVEDLQDRGDTGIKGIKRLPAPAPKGKRRGVPLAETLEPGATITLYVVYTSDPVEKGKQPSPNDMKRLGDQFLRKEDANKHAEVVLRDERYDDSHLVSIQFRVNAEDGLFFGTKELADGKLVMCMVQRERQMASNLDLSNVFVRKELEETYSSRFDVFYTNVIPKAFLKQAEAGNNQSKGQGPGPKSRSTTPSTAAAAEPDSAEKESVEKEHADNDRDSLFSASPTPGPEAPQTERAEAEAKAKGVGDNDKVDESDAESVATAVTLAPSEPGGNLGSLSWNDVEYVHEHVCGFTTMELANQEAYNLALKLWRPRGNRMVPWLYYTDNVRPSLEWFKIQELDVKPAELVFEVPESEGHVDDRPWPYIHSTVFVKETRLEGPREIGNYIVMGNVEDSGEEGDGEEDDEND
jgi:hypothetical protein